MTLQVFSRCAKLDRIILGPADQVVAATAKQTSNALAVVAVVYREHISAPVTDHSFRAPTDGAHSRLGREKSAVILRCDAIVPPQGQATQARCVILASFCVTPIFLPLFARLAVFFSRLALAHLAKVFDPNIPAIVIEKAKVTWGLCASLMNPDHAVRQSALRVNVNVATLEGGTASNRMPVTCDVSGDSTLCVGRNFAPAKCQGTGGVVIEQLAKFGLNKFHDHQIVVVKELFNKIQPPDICQPDQVFRT
jgi:hypothetical protein